MLHFSKIDFPLYFLCFYGFWITWYSDHINVFKFFLMLTKGLGKMYTFVTTLLNFNLHEVLILVFSSYFPSFDIHCIVRYSLNDNQDRDEPRLKKKCIHILYSTPYDCLHLRSLCAPCQIFQLAGVIFNILVFTLSCKKSVCHFLFCLIGI